LKVGFFGSDNDIVIISESISLKAGVIMEDELIMTWKKVFVA